MNDQGVAVELVDLGLVAVAGDGRELGDQIHSLEQGLVYVHLVGVLVVIIEGQRGGHQPVHQVLGGVAEQLPYQEIVGQLVALGQAVLEILEGMPVGQVAEEEQEGRLFVAEVAPAVLDQVVDAVTPVKELAFSGNYVALIVCGIADNVGDFGQTDPDAGSVLIPKTLLDVVFFEERIGNIRKNRGFAGFVLQQRRRLQLRL